MRQANSTHIVNYFMVLLIIAIIGICHCIEPISTGIVVSSVVGYGISTFYCKYYECCDKRSVPEDIQKLEASLSKSLFGQHMVQQHVISALRAHLKSNSPSRKPLVMSFHGTSGTGKSFVADQIAQALYAEGHKSKYVHKYFGRADFVHPEKLPEYKERLHREVRESITECPRSLFIFDEVDKMPDGIFDTLTSLVDYAPNVRNADYTKAIFIFLSNTAGVQISDHLANLMKKGKLREDTTLSDFEEMLKFSAYNMDGGFKKTNMIEAHVIDHYVPFLSLEKSHVVQCVEAEFRRWGISPSQANINKVISGGIIYDPKHSLFATSGCKTIEKKVAIVVHGERP